MAVDVEKEEALISVEILRTIVNMTAPTCPSPINNQTILTPVLFLSSWQKLVKCLLS